MPTINGTPRADEIDGTLEDDRLRGGAGADLLRGFGGDDLVRGDQGDDALYGDFGDDVMEGGAGNDRLFGGSGRDTLRGDGGHDLLDGGDGDDALQGGWGNDELHGGAGADILDGEGNDDRLFGEAEADVLRGGAGQDRLFGGTENDLLDGGVGNDRLDGGAHNDRLIGGDGHDTLIGGQGVDTAVYTGASSAYGYVVDASSGRVTVTGRGFRDSLEGVERLEFDDRTVFLTPNQAPQAGNDFFTVNEGRTAVLDVLANDSDADGDPLAIIAVTPAAHGVVTVEDGKLLYTPEAGFAGTDSFTYTITDGTGEPGGTVSAAVSVTVQDVGPQPPLVIETGALDAAQGFVIGGEAPGDLVAMSVASAGDVNGDGFADMLIGAREADGREEASGAAYVVYGGPDGFGVPVDGRQVVDLAALGAAEGFVVRGDAGGEFAGESVAPAGDVNGDGYADIVIGARLGDDGGNAAGEAYVVYGGPDGAGSALDGRQVLDVVDLAPADGFIIQGDSEGDLAGRRVASAGDVNGDGYDDLIVSAPAGDDAGAGAGEAYVVFGGAQGGGDEVSGRQVLDLTTLTAAQGFIIQGDPARQALEGTAAGDVNGDGYDDLILAARGDDGDADPGAAYVVFGKADGFGTDVAGRQVVDVSALAPADGFVLQADPAGTSLGDIASAGDLNGDGYAELVVSTPREVTLTDNGYESTGGETYVIYGRPGPFGTDEAGQQVLALASLAAVDGFVIQGGVAPDRGSAFAVASAGDVNADGYDDLLIGAPGEDEAFVVYGGADGFGENVNGRQVLDLATLGADEGFIVHALNDSQVFAGWSVAPAGDVNGDGFDDVMVGAPNFDSAEEGEAYVVFGGDFSGAVTHPGTGAGDVLTGSAADEVFVGGLGDDTLTGGGGADVLRGGGGDDALHVADAGFLRADGGGGLDVLVFDGEGMDLDFTGLSAPRVSGVERIDMRGAGANALTLDINDLLDFSAETNVLTVEGDPGDAVAANLDGGGFTASSANGYTTYASAAASLVVSDLVDQSGIVV